MDYREAKQRVMAAAERAVNKDLVVDLNILWKASGKPFFRRPSIWMRQKALNVELEVGPRREVFAGAAGIQSYVAWLYPQVDFKPLP
jgi:hypothetical protein